MKYDVIVVGAGPAGVLAAMRAADLGAKTALLASETMGGMAAVDGPFPVRTLAHAARLMRDARQLGQYGITVGEPTLNYARLVERVREVVKEAQAHSIFRRQIDQAGVTVHEQCGQVRFVDPHTLETSAGTRHEAAKMILCTGGVSRKLDVPGQDLTNTHSDAWSLTAAPPSMIVVGAGATGAQVASIFNAFGTKVQLFGRRMLPTEDADVSTAVAAAFKDSGIVTREDFGTIDRFEKTSKGVRMFFSKNNDPQSAEAALVVVAAGWVANTKDLRLESAGVTLNARGFIGVDSFLCTSAPHIFAAGDVTGRLMLVPQAIHDGFLAATNAVQGAVMKIDDQIQVAPIGSFTDPEYAQVGLTEAKARESFNVETAKVTFDSTARTIIDGRTTGFCKLIVDRESGKILGCHVVGERAVEITQVAAIAMAGEMSVETLAHVPLSFPTYAGILGRVAAMVTRTLNRNKKSAAYLEMR